jgi:hypothetical protein
MILDSFMRFRQFSLLTSPLLTVSLVLISTVTFTMLSCFLDLCVSLLLCFCSLTFHSSDSLHTSHSSHPHPFNSPQLILSLLSVFNRLHHRWTLSLSSYPFPFQQVFQRFISNRSHWYHPSHNTGKVHRGSAEWHILSSSVDARELQCECKSSVID